MTERTPGRGGRELEEDDGYLEGEEDLEDVDEDMDAMEDLIGRFAGGRR
jgi:hypothetical protein